jgi:lambda family phage portal protein
MNLFERILKRYGYSKLKPKARGYSGAISSRLTGDWLNPTTTGDEEIRRDLQKLRNRCRELERNNDYVRRYLNGLDSNVIGSKGIMLQMKVEDSPLVYDDQANRVIEKEWRKWCNRKHATPNGRQSWIDICKLALRSCARDGDVLLQLVRGFNNDHGFAVQLIEADMLDLHHNNYKLQNGGEIRMGVETNSVGRPSAYHILTAHPGETSDTSRRRLRVDADDIIHLYNPERISQTRGVPWMVSAMTRLQMLAGYEESELVASRVAASKMGFLTKDANTESYTGEEDEDYNLIMESEPGSIEELPTGMSFQEWNPTHPTTAYKDFVKSTLRGISAGLNISYNTLANDLENVNYSSIRAGLFDEREHYKSIQNWFIDSFIQPVFEAWLEASILNGVFPFGITKFDKMNQPKWCARRWPWVDPLKDMQANILAMNNGLEAKRNIINYTGGDIDDIYSTIAADNKLAEDKGLRFDAADMPIEDDEDNESEAIEETITAKVNEDKADNLSVKPTEALNGAQIQAALSVIEQVVNGNMPAEAGKELLVSLGLEEGAVDKMMSSMEGFEPTSFETELKPDTIAADE